MGRTRRVWAVASAVVLLGAVALLPSAYGTFVATDNNSGNKLTAAATFPDYPTAVNADSPLFYHRLDDTPGSTTADDSSGNNLTGVYGTAFAPAKALFPLDEGSGATAYDMAGRSPAVDATAVNTSWVAGHSGTALGFNGTSAYADTSATIVNTSNYFTVSAWVYLTSKASDMTAVSQVDTGNSGFRLEYLSGVDRFAFSMPQSNAAGATVDQIVATGSAPNLNTWYHIVGSYEATMGGNIYLYVDDVEYGLGGGFGGLIPHTSLWNATGPVEIGAAKLNNVRGEWWHGRIDEVRVNQGAITASPVREQYNSHTAGPSTNWQFDEAVGSATTNDLADDTNTGTLGSGAAIVAAGKTSNGLQLDGTANGYVSGRTSSVDTTASFTAAAWVYLTGTAAHHAAISQGGTTGSSFELKYSTSGAGRWEFLMSQAESMTPVVDYAFATVHAVVTNTWVHLAGVFDANAGTLSLYVNGAADGTATHTSVWNGNATGLQVGRQREFGGWVNPWPGKIDDARTWRRALTASEITRVYGGSLNGTTVFGSTSLGAEGALQGAQQGQQWSSSQAFSGSKANGYNPTRYTNPTTFSLECWFRGVRNGGRLISFGDTANGDSTTYGRMLWVNSGGNVMFGAGSGTTNVITSPGTYLDGAWHHVVASLGPANGMVLYIDGVAVGTQATYALGNYTGMWRWGGEATNATWPGPTYFYGQIDEVAVYGTELGAQQVSWHYHANH